MVGEYTCTPLLTNAVCRKFMQRIYIPPLRYLFCMSYFPFFGLRKRGQGMCCLRLLCKRSLFIFPRVCQLQRICIVSSSPLPLPRTCPSFLIYVLELKVEVLLLQCAFTQPQTLRESGKSLFSISLNLVRDR
jgi:hypothetical protein